LTPLSIDINTLEGFHYQNSSITACTGTMKYLAWSTRE